VIGCRFEFPGRNPGDVLAAVDEAMVPARFLAGMYPIGEHFIEVLRKEVAEQKIRPAHSGDSHLARTWNFEVFVDGEYAAVGIGDVDRLTAEAPYWRVINDGTSGQIGMMVPGHFVSGGTPREPLASRYPQDSFAYMGFKSRPPKRYPRPVAGGPKFLMVVGRPITAKRYIERAAEDTMKNMDQLTTELRAAFWSLFVENSRT